jgi:3-phenylpropionate/cinnamic acid dioxygenase small subunit
VTQVITADDLVDFIYAEADMLDEQRFEAWLSLFAEDGHYWMPATRDQTDTRLQASLMYEDLLLLRVRVTRLGGLRTFSQKPVSHCHHVLQRPRVLTMDHSANRFITRTSFNYTETRRDDCERLAGWASHELALIDGQIRIRLKRVDLLNVDAPLPSIQLFI